MSRPPGAEGLIPPTLHGQLFDLSQNLNPATQRKWTDEQLAGWLLEHHNITAQRETVSRLLGPLRRAAREALLERVRASAAEKIPEQFAKLDELMDKAHADGMNARASRTRMRAADTFRKALETKVRSIAGDDAKVTISGSPNTLAEFLGATFGDAEGPGDGAPGPLEE